MKTLDQNSIGTLLSKNYIGRNQQLATFIRLINKMNDSQVLAIDGAWGSGKTVFVKQLDLLCNKSDTLQSIPSIDHEDIKELQNTYASIYYNAWENDYFEDALQSLLYNLIAKIDEEQSSLPKGKKAVDGRAELTALVETIQNKGLGYDKGTTSRNISIAINEIIKRRDNIKTALEDLVGSSQKRILFIIDELDRCSPTFGVKVLETIKHYFEIDGITFVLAVNTEQLAHTVKKFYGNDFDGYGYLNKFFDFPFSLKAPDTKMFAADYLGKPKSSNITTKTPIEVADFLQLKMREIESYYLSLATIDDYMRRQGFYDDENIEYIAQCVFVPLALALKIKSGQDYNSFASGNNTNILVEFLEEAPDTVRFAGQFCRDKTLVTQGTSDEEAKKTIIKFTVDIYNDLFKIRKDQYAREAYNAFVDATNIIGYYTTIEEPKSGDEEK